ncbi:MAG TPA: type II secretion system protein GspM [Stellaceae bacterium]|nr:type II secretion system protein GspM [Stellaceae bacterium]
MTLAERPGVGRAAALAILAVLTALFVIGPLAAYCDLISDNRNALADKAAVLERYRLLAAARPTSTPAPAGPPLLYADMPESQASALLQETVKHTAAAAHVQVQGLLVLRSETANGVTRIGVRVRASGDMASLRGLIYAIETARPVLYPDNLSIQSHPPSPGAVPSVLDFQLDILGFKAEPAS